MNWKKCAEDDLRKYAGLKGSIENIPLRIEALHHKFGGIRGAQSDKIPVFGGGTHIEDFYLDNIVERERLKALLEANTMLVQLVDKGLSSLNEKERLVLDKFFVNRHYGYIDELVEELRLEQAQVYRLKNSALYKFTVNMYGIEEY